MRSAGSPVRFTGRSLLAMRDLYPGLGFDPTPGEPADVATVLATLSDGAEAVSEVSSMLGRAVRPGGWRGEAASAFRAGTAALPGVLEEVSDRVFRAREALTSWQAHLSANKREADRLDRTARALRDDPEALARVLDQAHRLSARHLRQAAAAARAVRALTGVVVPQDAWGTGADVVAGTSAQVSMWTGEVAAMPWPTTVAAAAPGSVATLPTGTLSVPMAATGAPPTPTATSGPLTPVATVPAASTPVAGAPARSRPLLPLTRLPLDTPARPVAAPPTTRPASRKAAPPTRTSAAAPSRERTAEPARAGRRHQELRAAGPNPGSPSPAGNPTGGPVPPHHGGGRPASTHSAGNSPVRAIANGSATPSAAQVPAPSAVSTSTGQAGPAPGAPSPNPGSPALTGGLPASGASPSLTPITGAGPTSGAGPSPGPHSAAGIHSGPNASGNSAATPGGGSNPNSGSATGGGSATGSASPSGTNSTAGHSPGSDDDTDSDQPTIPADPNDPEAETDLGLTAMALGAAAGRAQATTHPTNTTPGRLTAFLLTHPTNRPVLTVILTRHTDDGRVHRRQIFVPCAPLDSPRNPPTPTAATPDLLTTSERNSNG